VTELPATVLADPEWLRADLDTARAMYGPIDERVLGTVRWYMASSVLLGPAAESAVADRFTDPALDAVTLRLHPDGRYIDAVADRAFPGDLDGFGAALGDALAAVVSAVSSACGAGEPALWAIATDSLANRLLWAGQAAGDVDGAIDLAARLAETIGHRLPAPRYVQVGRNRLVRRASCCLLYRIPGEPKCVSCPRQTPEQRAERLRPFG